MTTAATFDLSRGAEETFAAELVDGGVLTPTSEPGVWQKSARFEWVVSAIERFIGRQTAADGARVLGFAPVIDRASFERSGFLKSFPHLAGAVHCFGGDQAGHRALIERIDAGEDWSDLVEPSGVVLLPAACYPVYPAHSGRLAPGGALIDVSSWCFRHEPSADPARMQAFRMHEHVRIGTPDDVVEFRDRWIVRAEQMFEALGVPAYPAPANDPFFGRGGKLLAIDQREQKLKFELVVPITSRETPTAIMSFNYHRDHFGVAFAIETSDGAVAHTACVGFGLERIALALLKTHGLVPTAWPSSVKRLLEQ